MQSQYQISNVTEQYLPSLLSLLSCLFVHLFFHLCEEVISHSFLSQLGLQLATNCTQILCAFADIC